MKLDKLIYDVREGVKAFSDDTELDDRYITYLYGIKRSKYLRQDLNNYQKTADNSIKQSFCEALEEVSANECGLDIECDTLLRTVRPIPTPIELHTKTALTSVKPTNRLSIPFSFITKRRATMIEGARFQKMIYAFLDDDGYVYVTSGTGNEFKLLECLTITGVFEDPLALQDYVNCCGCTDAPSCFDASETDYPIQPHYIDVIRNEIIIELLQKFKIPEDKTNDSVD
tara:strand:- start:70210 stop:70893 length:684 start_codon:yes stop_codon:yes gene_type:complete